MQSGSDRNTNANSKHNPATNGAQLGFSLLIAHLRRAGGGEG